MVGVDAYSKIPLLISLSLVLASVAGAASIEPQNGDSTVWLEGKKNADGLWFQKANQEEFSYACKEGYTVDSIELNGSAISASGDKGKIQTKDFEGYGGEEGIQSYNLELICIDGNSTNKDSQPVELRSLRAEVKGSSQGRGFVNGKLEKDLSTGFGARQSLEVKVKGIDGRRSLEYLLDELGGYNGDNFALAPSDLKLGRSDYKLEGKRGDSEGVSDDRVVIKLTPTATSFVDSYRKMEIKDEDGSVIYETDYLMKPKIFKWNAIPVKGAIEDSQIDFQKVDEEYWYELNLEWKGGETGQKSVEEENFRLTVEKWSYDKIGDNWEEIDLSEKPWFTINSTKAGSNHVIELTQEGLNELRRKLEKGNRYRFTLEMKDDEMFSYDLFPDNEGSFVVDRVKVPFKNRSYFEGRVIDSKGKGVETIMNFMDDTPEKVDTGIDGTYSERIKRKTYPSVSLQFFDRGNSYPDSTLLVRKADISKSSNLGVSAANVRYDYSSGSEVDIPGVDAEALASVKFAYDMFAAESMNIHYSGPHPRNIVVYECKLWSFPSESCSSDEGWNKVNRTRWSGSYTWPYSIKINQLPLYTPNTTDQRKNILMNAYIVGTNSALQLEGPNPLTVNKRSVAANGEIEISGAVESTGGGSVEDAEVTVSLLNNGTSRESYTATTGPDGVFRVEGSAPSESGTYKIHVTAEKGVYESYEKKSRANIEVFYRKGMEMSTPENPELELGNTSSLSFKLSNTGQIPVRDIDVSVSGIEQKYYAKKGVPAEIADSDSFSLDIKLPKSYCPAPCANPPVIDVKVTGTADGEEVESSYKMFTSIDRSNTQKSESSKKTEEEASSKSPEPSNSTNLPSSIKNDINRMTGNFLKRQSSVNVALGLIMVFTMILALAIKKKKDGGERRRGGGQIRGGSQQRRNHLSQGESRVSKPKVSPQSTEVSETVQEVEEEKEEDEESSDKDVEESDDEESEGSEEKASETAEEEENSSEEMFSCEECGEEFDTKEGLKMHKKINGLE